MLLGLLFRVSALIPKRNTFSGYFAREIPGVAHIRLPSGLRADRVAANSFITSSLAQPAGNRGHSSCEFTKEHPQSPGRDDHKSWLAGVALAVCIGVDFDLQRSHLLGTVCGAA